MHFNKYLRVFTLLFATTIPLSSFARSGGPDDGLANNPPNRQNCTSCHSSFGLNSGQGSLALAGLPESYEPGETYRLSLTLSDPNARRWGFELTSLTENNGRAGSIAVVNQQSTQLSNVNDRPQYLKQRSAGTFQGQANNASWEFDWTAPVEGTGDVIFYSAGNAANSDFSTNGDRIYAIESRLPESAPPPPPPPDSIIVQLAEGWNFLSSPVSPVSPEIATLFAGLVSNGALITIIDKDGSIFDPIAEIDEIENWMPYNSYQIKVSADSEMKFSGEFVDPTHTFSLDQGWNWISYPRMDSLHPAQLMAEIGFAASVIRSGDGRFAVPGIGVGNLPLITPGSGLQILGTTDEPYEFSFPEPDGELEPPDELAFPNHFQTIDPTGLEMNLLVTGWVLETEPTDGDEIEIRDAEGRIVGSAVIQSSQMLISVFGDDWTTEEIDGASEGTLLSFKYWIPNGNREFDVEGFTGEEAGVIYNSGSYKEIALKLPNEADLSISNTPQTFELLGVYPNPFNPWAEVGFRLAKSGPVSIKIFDNSGRFLRDLSVSHYEAGEHRAVVSGEGLANGVYLIGVESNGIMRLSRAVMLR